MLDFSSYLILLLCRRQHLEPIIGLIECPSIHAVKSYIRALDDFPCVAVPCNARDSDYQVAQYPLLFFFCSLGLS